MDTHVRLAKYFVFQTTLGGWNTSILNTLAWTNTEGILPVCFKKIKQQRRRKDFKKYTVIIVKTLMDRNTYPNNVILSSICGHSVYVRFMQSLNFLEFNIITKHINEKT